MIPNWVSWHLEESDLGDVKQKNDFRADTDLPEKWYAVKGGRVRAEQVFQAIRQSRDEGRFRRHL